MQADETILILVSAGPSDKEGFSRQVVAKLPRRTRVAVVAFASAVSVFRLPPGPEAPAFAAADVVSGHTAPTSEAQLYLTMHMSTYGPTLPYI